jgi:hypothetical protein
MTRTTNLKKEERKTTCLATRNNLCAKAAPPRPGSGAGVHNSYIVSEIVYPLNIGFPGQTRHPIQSAESDP